MAISDLPVLDITEYNGYTFPSNVDTTSYRVEPLYDPAGRTVWACRFQIALKWIDSDPEGRGGSLNARSKDAVSLLTKNAGELKYRGRGFGTPPTVNGGARVRDVEWGPKPGPLEMKPHGGATVEYSWSVSFTLPTCSDATYFGIAWFNYGLQFARDSHGYSTRTYTAKLKIAQTKPTVDSRLIPDSADRYLELVVPALLSDFRRERVDHSVSEDKSELTVTVVDTELPPAAPPPGVVECDFSHNYTSKSLAEFVGVFSARYQLPKGGNVTLALLAYYLLVLDRIARAQKMTLAGGAPGLPAAVVAGLPTAVAVRPIAFSCEESNVYGRTEARLTTTYMASGVFFNEVLAKGGLWSPVPAGAGGDWKAWSASIPNALSPRGFANLTFAPGEDKILDLCRAEAPSVPGATATGGALASVVAAGTGAASGALAAAVAAAFPKAAPASSWLEYRPHVTIVADTGRAPVTTLPTSPLSSAPRQNAQSAWDAMNAALPATATGSFGLIPGAQVPGNAQQAGETVVQQRTKPNFYVVFTGTALRSDYPIPCPELLTVNGKRPTLIGQPQFAQAYMPGSITPIVRAWWSMTYLFTDDQGGPPTQPIGPAPTILA